MRNIPIQENTLRLRFHIAIAFLQFHAGLLFIAFCPHTIKNKYAATVATGIIGCSLIQFKTGIGSYFFSKLKAKENTTGLVGDLRRRIKVDVSEYHRRRTDTIHRTTSVTGTTIVTTVCRIDTHLK